MSLPKFTPPKDFVAPEGIADGDTFEVSATLKKDGDKLCLVKIDDVPMPGYEEKAAKGEKANEGAASAAVEADFAQRYASAMSNPPM
jgi:hypothetical protein